jgi:hypothetical protein
MISTGESVKKILAALVLVPGLALATPFETSSPSATTCTNLDHYNVHAGTVVTSVAPTLNASGQCYFHYDVGPLIVGLTTAAANSLLATYSVAAANALNMESAASPFAALPGVPSAPGALVLTVN